METKIKYIHFIGIGGSGMSGIAEIMHNMNFVISGSDPNQSSVIEHLRKRGIQIFSKHDQKNVKKVDVVVTSTAIPKNNPEIVAAKKQNIPIIPRAEMLSELMRFKEGIAIAGTHGKTSTTSILATIMNDAGLDPTYVIGGRINSLKQNARLGKSKYMIVEADESDASFLHLNPSNVLVTNIDNDHMETYGHDEERLKQTFIDFIHQIPFYNEVFLCIDDKILNQYKN
jgi:UDP-N-acetylmuramate--alanine ligase